jgi:hypothetical protein
VSKTKNGWKDECDFNPNKRLNGKQIREMKEKMQHRRIKNKVMQAWNNKNAPNSV